MRLARHDELVERMARAIHRDGWEEQADTHWDNYPGEHLYYYNRATAALDALLTAVVEMGVGEHHKGKAGYSVPHLTLQLEEEQP